MMMHTQASVWTLQSSLKCDRDCTQTEQSTLSVAPRSGWLRLPNDWIGWGFRSISLAAVFRVIWFVGVFEQLDLLGISSNPTGWDVQAIWWVFFSSYWIGWSLLAIWFAAVFERSDWLWYRAIKITFGVILIPECDQQAAEVVPKNIYRKTISQY